MIGFQPPMSDDPATTSPVGADASAMPAISIAEGFNLGYCKARPGKGPLMHNHDTNETFIAMTGKWRCEWNEGDKMEYVDLDPYDVISFPVGVARRFMNVTYHEPGKEHLLMFIIGGNQPQAEFTPRRCAAARSSPRSASARCRASRSAGACCCSRRRASCRSPPWPASACTRSSPSTASRPRTPASK